MSLPVVAGFNDTAMIEQLKALFADQSADDLSANIAQSFPIVSFKGKVWRVRVKGEDKAILDPTTGDPVASLVAVIVKVSPNISKLYYAKTFEEGDDAKPDCFSLDGVFADSSVLKTPTGVPKQPCASCPKNQWGSKINTSGQKLKACADHKRMAIVPFADLGNQGNGPMLLRIPPASLQNLASLANPLKQLGVPYQAVAVKISFDHNLAYPKLTFQPVRALNAEQARVIKDYLESGELERMLTVPDDSERAELAPTQAPAHTSPGSLAQAAMGAVAGAAAVVVEKVMSPRIDPEQMAQAQIREANRVQAEEAKPTSKQVAMDEGQTIEGDATLDSMLHDILNG